MAEGEKTPVFWAGLLILSVASLELFWVAWSYSDYLYMMTSIPRGTGFSLTYLLTSAMPLIVGGITFILIGLYMTKSGIRKNSHHRT